MGENEQFFISPKQKYHILFPLVGSIVLIKAFILPFVTPALRRICIPYVPATKTQIDNVRKFLNLCHGPLLDLGSGDGRIVFEATKAGINSAHGVEINIWLVLYSRIKAKVLQRVEPNLDVKFYHKSMWDFPLHNYKTLVVFGVKEMTNALQLKISKEFSGDHIIACRVPLLEPLNIKLKNKFCLANKLDEGINSVYMYKKISCKDL